MKITIIGAGNMGGALALGLASAGRTAASDITVTAAHPETLARFAQAGLNTCTDNSLAVAGADVVFLVVKPWIVPEVVKELSGKLDGKLVVSVAPGVKSTDLSEMLGKGVERLAYVIPNTAIEVCESMTFIAPVSAGEDDIKLLEGIFEGTGKTMVVPERQLSAGTCLASCGIAYALRYIRAAAEGGVELGMYPKDAQAIVAQTVKGAAAILEAHGSHAEAEIDKVTTPGGLTIKGLNAMEEAGFTNSVIKGLKAGR